MARFSRNRLLSVAVAVGGAMAMARYHRGRQAAEVETVELVSEDGHPVTGFLRVPKGAGPFPALVLLHGGHGGAPVRALTMVRTRVASALCEQGYALLAVAYRRHAWLRGEVDDAVAGFRFLQQHPRVDACRVGLFGNSHGGSIALTTAPRVAPQVVVSSCAVTDAEAMLRFVSCSHLRMAGPLIKEALTDLERSCGGTFEQCPEVYRAMSPVFRALQIECPVFIVHGSQDALVPVTHAYVLRDALAAADKPHELHVVPRMPHSFLFHDRPEAAATLKSLLAFLDQHLQGKP
jgi:dipeptidyl aminopeptidase/acylaminoacyl peptidase